MWRLAWLDSLDRAARIVVDLPGLCFPEVKIVDGSDPAQKVSSRARQCTDLVTADVVDRVGLQMRETNDIGNGTHLMGNDQIIGDGGDVHPVEGSGCTADLYRRGRSRRVGNGVIHHRLLNRHLGTRTAGTASMTSGLGHETSRAATIAATSSSLAAGEISNLMAYAVAVGERPPGTTDTGATRAGCGRRATAREPSTQCEEPKRAQRAEVIEHI